MNAEETITCQYCGKEGVKKAHERFCASNPNNVRSKKKKTLIEKIQDNHPDIKAAMTPEPEQPKQQEIPVIISNLAPVTTYSKAWYEGGVHRQIEAIGIVKSDGNEIPWGLVITPSGMLLPPYMLPGFVGVSELPPETEQATEPDTTEPFPPFPEEADEPEQTKITSDNKIPEGVITEKHMPTIITNPVKSSFWDIFKRKPKPVPTEYKPVSVETRNLLEEISEV